MGGGATVVAAPRKGTSHEGHEGTRRNGNGFPAAMGFEDIHRVVVTSVTAMGLE
jgi:hypothetical protein